MLQVSHGTDRLEQNVSNDIGISLPPYYEALFFVLVTTVRDD